jgi:hypothetical protein
MKKAVGLVYYNVGRSPMFELQQMLLSPVVGEILNVADQSGESLEICVNSLSNKIIYRVLL